jgi:hypothetical protein
MPDNRIVIALKQIEFNLDRLPERFQNAMKGERGFAANRAIRALRTVPGPPIHPIRWTNERQRRAYFASKGFGRGVPSRRGSPPEVTAGWRGEFIPTQDGGILALINESDHVDFVQGFRAQGFHLDTGWVQLSDVTDDFFRDAEGAAVQVFFEEASPLEGV